MPACPDNFVLLVEMGFHHVGQAGLELLTSGDLPLSLASFGFLMDWSNEPFYVNNRHILIVII